jgi:hypothetical protein
VTLQVDGGLNEEAFVRKFSRILAQPPSELTRLFLKVSLSSESLSLWLPATQRLWVDCRSHNPFFLFSGALSNRVICESAAIDRSSGQVRLRRYWLPLRLEPPEA